MFFFKNSSTCWCVLFPKLPCSELKKKKLMSVLNIILDKHLFCTPFHHLHQDNKIYHSLVFASPLFFKYLKHCWSVIRKKKKNTAGVQMFVACLSILRSDSNFGVLCVALKSHFTSSYLLSATDLSKCSKKVSMSYLTLIYPFDSLFMLSLF
jgi:hypothetical protein